MKKSYSKIYTGNKTKNVKSVTERLRLQNNTKNQSFEKIPNTYPHKNISENSVEEYPRLRKPKPETLLKIQTHQRKTDDYSKVAKDRQVEENASLSLGQEFLKKNGQARTDLLNKYDQRENQGNVFSADSAKAQLTLEAKHNIRLNRHLLMTNQPPKNCTNLNSKMITKSLNYCEQHLVNILHIKVRAHPNGFFAEDLPLWYNKTFKKDLPLDWLELLQVSKQFEVENVQNKVVLYVKVISDNKKNIDLNPDSENPKNEAEEPDSVVHFVRYKHLQKSLKEYKSAGRFYSNASK